MDKRSSYNNLSLKTLIDLEIPDLELLSEEDEIVIAYKKLNQKCDEIISKIKKRKSSK